MKSFQTGGESGKTAKITVKWETFFSFCSNRLGLARSLCLIFDLWGPLHMSPVDRDEFRLGFIWEISAWFPRREKAKDPGTSSGAKFEKQSRHGETKNLTLVPTIASVTLTAVSLQLNGMFMISKIQQAMQDDAIQTARIHPAFILVTGMNEEFIWQNFEPAYRDLGWKNWDLGNRASPSFHMLTSIIRGKARSRKPGSPEEAWVKFERDVLKRSQYCEQSPGHFASSWETRRKWGSGLNHVKLLKPP